MSGWDPPQRTMTVGSRQIVASGPPAPSDPLALKRVCFYKSGDPQFAGFRAVISGRTFKSFDALLDGLSKKVPLDFGVRTITTPQGTHSILSLEELEDGKSYLCSDQKKVKPIDLDAARKRLVPWNASLPASRGRRASQQAGGRPRRESSVVRRMPKMLSIFRNGDPGTKRSIRLQKASSLTFEALLGHISEVMQFPVAKLYTTDGRMVDGHAALLCSTVVASSGDEPFRPDSYSLQKPPQTSRSASHLEPNRLQPRPKKSKSLSKRNSRNFSPSSETFLENQINDSMSGSRFHPHSSSTVDTAGVRRGSAAGSGALVPPDFNDIEKSCRINQDGSMTVEMKVRLMLKEEETIHWTTTLSRSSTTCWPGEAPAPQEPADGRSLDTNSHPIDDSDDDTGVGGSPVNLSMPVAGARDPDKVGGDEDVEKPRFRRVQTPGPKALRKKQPSTESIQTESDTEVQENVVGASYTHVEQTAGSTMVQKHCSLTQQYCGQPMPKPRSATAANRSELHSAFRASRSAEVLQIQNNGREVTESVLRVYEQQSCFDSYLGTSQHQSVSRTVHSQRFSTDMAPHSSSNGNCRQCERPAKTSESPCCRESSTSSETAVPSYRIRNNLSSFTDNEAFVTEESPSELSLQDTDCSESNDPCRGKKLQSEERKVKKRAIARSLIPGRTLAEGTDLRGGRLVKSTSDIAHDRGADGIRAEGTAECEQGTLGKMKKKKTGLRDRDDIRKSSTLSLNIKHVRESVKEINLTEGKTISETKLNVSTFAQKNLLDIQPPLMVRKMLVKQWSMNEERKGMREKGEMSESVSMPVLHSSPSAANEYVENWLEKMPPQDATSCAEDARGTEPETKVQFQISSDSFEESDAKCEMKSAPNEHSTCEHITERLSSGSPTDERSQLGPKHEWHMRENTGIEKSHVSLIPTTEMPKVKVHKSVEALVQSGAEMPLATEAAQESKIKPLLEQLYSSIQSINQVSEHRHTPCLAEAHCVPEFSSQVASVFGSSSKMLIAFLAVLSLKEGLASLGSDQKSMEDSSVPEALQMVKALHKLATIENTDELKTGLSDLHRSASSKLLQSWRSFQRFSGYAYNPEGIEASEHPTLSEENLEECSNQEGYPYGFQELVEELGISGKLQRGLSCLVMGDMMDNFKRSEEPMEKSEEANRFVESTIKEDYFVAAVREIGVNDFAQSVTKDEISTITPEIQSITEEVHDFTQSDQKKEINKPEESILEENDDVSVQEKEINNLKEPVLVEEDDFSQSAPEEDMRDHALFLPENDFAGSGTEGGKGTEHDISRNDSPSINVDEDSQQHKHSTLEEAGYLEERGRHMGQPVISVQQGQETTCMQMKVTESEAFQLPSSEHLKEVESMADESKDRVRRAKLQTGSKDCEGLSHGAISCSLKIPEDLLDYVRSVLVTSSLVVCYDSRGNLRIEPERPCDRRGKGVSEYGQKQLPSPTISGLSDYRETSESDRCSSRLSVELSSEGEGECSGIQGENNTNLEETAEEEIVEEFHAGELSSDPDGRIEKTGSVSQGQSSECATLPMDEDTGDGVLIDKGRWLLKENHLIRKSPPVPCGMYGNMETTSADTTLDDVSEDIPCHSQPVSHHSPMAVLSSSELEELAGPVMPKCTYFNMSHGSDSEPFQDELSDGSRKGFDGNRNGNGKAARTKTELGVSPSDEHHETLARKCGSLSSFASVELKMAENKVHPQAGPSGRAPVERQPGGASSTANRTLNDDDSGEKLRLVCGQHCPIL